MKKALLLHLANFLDEVVYKSKPFNMEYWMISSNDDYRVIKELPVVLQEEVYLFECTKGKMAKIVMPGKCASAGCAIGWAATHPDFIEHGLCLALFSEIRSHSKSATVAINNGREITHVQFSAVAHLFEISITDAKYLFSDDEYDKRNCEEDEGKKRVTPKQVANRIREFCEMF